MRSQPLPAAYAATSSSRYVPVCRHPAIFNHTAVSSDAAASTSRCPVYSRSVARCRSTVNECAAGRCRSAVSCRSTRRCRSTVNEYAAVRCRSAVSCHFLLDDAGSRSLSFKWLRSCLLIVRSRSFEINDKFETGL